MSTIVLRNTKGTPLTIAELDANFSNLNTDKMEKSNNLSDLTSASTARTNLNVDVAGTAATLATAAQSAAQSYADGVAATAQTNATKKAMAFSVVFGS